MAKVPPEQLPPGAVQPTWLTARATPRVHLLPALRRRVCVVVVRLRSKLFHVLRWDTARDLTESGSWFRGKLYAKRCDVSWDGRYMVYLAMGRDGRTWNGVCEPPWLRTLVDCENVGTWSGGGVFTAADVLESYTFWHAKTGLDQGAKVPGIDIRRRDAGGEDMPVLASRLERDGWRRLGPNRGTSVEIEGPGYMVANLGDDGWQSQPSPRHPALRCFLRGYFAHGYTFAFELEGAPEFGDDVEWATWDAGGDLLVARDGWIERYDLDALQRRAPAFRMDLGGLQPPRVGPEG